MQFVEAAGACVCGTVEIESKPGVGVTIRDRFPEADGQILPLRPLTLPNVQTA